MAEIAFFKDLSLDFTPHPVTGDVRPIINETAIKRSLMNLIKTKLDGLVVLKPTIFKDNRGYFMESYNQKNINKLLGNVNFVQDNHSKSYQGVLRGLHYQLPPHAQGKLVRVIQGEVLDIAVDIRQSSPTFGQYVAQILSDKNKKQLYIPEGFAHGFLTLSNTSEFLYKTTNFYHPQSERCILWNDTTLNIHWPENLNIQLSPKDLKGHALNESELFL